MRIALSIIFVIVSAAFPGKLFADDAGLHVYKIVDELIAHKNFTPSTISKILKLKAKRVSNANPYFDFYSFEGKNGDVIKNAELRIPNKKSDKKDGMVVVDFSDSLNLNLDDLYSRYGREGWTFIPPPPNQPSAYHSKTIGGQKVDFGTGSKPPYPLKAIIIDRID